ncbi:MAG: DUF488 family protein [Acidimicrobiales bacterium]
MGRRIGCRKRVRVERVYDPVVPGDGCRVLVDRLWPRGVRRDDVALDRWMPEVSRRTSFVDGSDIAPTGGTSSTRYEAELMDEPAALDELVALARAQPLTLLYSARDRDRNQAVVLAALVRAALAD